MQMQSLLHNTVVKVGVFIVPVVIMHIYVNVSQVVTLSGLPDANQRIYRSFGHQKIYFKWSENKWRKNWFLYNIVLLKT